jgi:hypothetical protein
LDKGIWAILSDVWGVVELISDCNNVVISNLVILIPSPPPPTLLLADSEAVERSWGSGVRRGEDGERVEGGGREETRGVVTVVTVVIVVALVELVVFVILFVVVVNASSSPK